MDAIKNLLSLRTKRAFTDEIVPDDVIAAMLEVARWTGTASNKQRWRLIVVRSQKTLKSLSGIGVYCRPPGWSRLCDRTGR